MKIVIIYIYNSYVFITFLNPNNLIINFKKKKEVAHIKFNFELIWSNDVPCHST